MNIFVVDTDPKIAAKMLCDKHVLKMPVESAQMLSTVHRMLDGKHEKRLSKSGKRKVDYWVHPTLENSLYKAVHFNHPCTVWTRETSENYMWHYAHWVALCEEFEYRYNKVHKSFKLLKDILAKLPENIRHESMTPFPLAMKEYPQIMDYNDPVGSYHRFYHEDKAKFAEWNKGRTPPNWWKLAA